MFSLGITAQTTQIRGRIIDSENSQPIEYATITLQTSSGDAFIDGVVTSPSGEFLFSQVHGDQVILEAQFMGYEDYRLELTMSESEIDLGDILLQIASVALSEVEVTARKTTSIQKIDKQIYSADQFQNAKGGNATDVIMNLPSVSINSFGEISVRGTTGFLLMINGKAIQTDPAVILQQLSANTIDDIEIITAPSAKYDPDGHAGIINIKTKQGITDGLFLNANVLIGLPSVEPYDNAESAPRYGADVNVNYKRDKWDLSAGLDYRRYDISGRRVGYVNTYMNEVLTEFPSSGERSFDEINYAGRLAVQYSPQVNQRLSLGVYAGKRSKDRTADILYDNQQRSQIRTDQFAGTEAYYDSFVQTGSVLSGTPVLNRYTFYNENLRIRRGDFFIASLDYSFQFDDNSTLSLSGLYEKTILGGPTNNVSLDYPGLTRILQLQFNENDNPLDGVRLQFDYKKALGDVDWEAGYQFRSLQHPGDFVYFDRDLEADVWVENPLFTNTIDLSRTIHSVYNQLSGQQEKWDYNVGLRLEYFDRQVDIARPNETYDLEAFNVFPSFTVGYAVTEDFTAKLAYSRRIERTTTFKMTPFPEREHSETLEQGDAELLPEYIDVLEAGVIQEWGDHSVFANVYLRNVDNVINRVNTVFNDTILNRIYTNVGQAKTLGLEVGTTFYPTQKIRCYVGGNVFDYNITGDLFGDEINTSAIVYSVNANANINFGQSTDLQLALNYLSERVTAQGRDSRFYNPSMTLRKSFGNKRYSVALQWLNMDMGLLNSNEQRITTVRDAFYTTTNYIYEVDILQLNFSYQLNQSKHKMDLPQSEFGKKEF